MQLDLKTLGLDKLTRIERLQLIDLIWDSVGDQVEPEDIPDWHLPELDRRLADLDANPRSGRPWEEVLADLRKKAVNRGFDLQAFGIDQLTVSERLQLMDFIVSGLPEEVDPAEFSDAQWAEIRRRREVADANPGAGRPWREVLDDIRRKL